jgi:hypothetical protein
MERVCALLMAPFCSDCHACRAFRLAGLALMAGAVLYAAAALTTPRGDAEGWGYESEAAYAP